MPPLSGFPASTPGGRKHFWRHLGQGAGLTCLAVVLLGWSDGYEYSGTSADGCSTEEYQKAKVNETTGKTTTLLTVSIAGDASVVAALSVNGAGIPYTGGDRQTTATVRDPDKYTLVATDKCGAVILTQSIASGLKRHTDSKGRIYYDGPDALTVTLSVPAGYPITPCATPTPTPIPTATPTPKPAGVNLSVAGSRAYFVPDREARAQATLTFTGTDGGSRTAIDLADSGLTVSWQLRDVANESVLQSGSTPMNGFSGLLGATVATPYSSAGIRAYWAVSLEAPGTVTVAAASLPFVLAEPAAQITTGGSSGRTIVQPQAGASSTPGTDHTSDGTGS